MAVIRPRGSRGGLEGSRKAQTLSVAISVFSWERGLRTIARSSSDAIAKVLGRFERERSALDPLYTPSTPLLDPL
eukprot:5881728-Pyramimonas_sp.AAC.1